MEGDKNNRKNLRQEKERGKEAKEAKERRTRNTTSMQTRNNTKHNTTHTQHNTTPETTQQQPRRLTTYRNHHKHTTPHHTTPHHTTPHHTQHPLTLIKHDKWDTGVQGTMFTHVTFHDGFTQKLTYSTSQDHTLESGITSVFVHEHPLFRDRKIFKTGP